MNSTDDPLYLRGARSHLQGRFESAAREAFDDGWTPEEQEAQALQTTVTIERSRSIISRNDSPDIGFSQSINPYRGCEHGCIYCYARPSHSYLELSPGLDFETQAFRQDQRRRAAARGAGAARLPAEPDRARRQHRLLPADRAQAPHHARDPRGARRVRAPGHHRHQVGADRARPRPARPDGGEEPGEGVRLHRHARPRAGAEARAARRQPATTARRFAISFKRKQYPCGVMVAALIPALNDKTLEHVLEAGRRGRARPKPPTSSCACRTSSRCCSRNGWRRTTRSAPTTSSASSTRCAAGATTTRASARA